MIEAEYQVDARVGSDVSGRLEIALDQYLRQLLDDLRLYVPYEAAAAWLGHDDRPSLRVVVPAGAELPAVEGARHAIFQATGEAACIADLHAYSGSADGDWRCWLGVPLVLHGQRRGWIEVLSTQPQRFSDLDLQRAATVVRYAAFGLSQLEVAFHAQHTGHLRDVLLHGLERALLAPTIEKSVQRMLEAFVHGSHAQSATLVLPIELAYALKLHQQHTPPHLERHFEETHLVTVAARWPAEDGLLNTSQDSASLLDDSDVLLPCTVDDEAAGWVVLHFAQSHPLGIFDPAAGQSMAALMTALLVWMRDQTQRELQAQQSVRMLVQHTHQLRSSSITDLMAGLAHELNNPLSAMIGITTLLQRDTSLDAEVRHDLASIAGEAHRISEFVKRLSNFGQSSGVTKAPLKLNDVVRDTVAVCEGLAQQRNVTIDVRLPDESPVVLGNRSQLQQVCLDLVSNALEAIETSETPQVVVEAICEGGWAVLRVSDTGYGVPDDLRERIFTPGFTTKTTGGTRRGLGMGLPMALDIVRNHWGTISVTSQLWQGSTFVVQLPLI